jgi:hypothetical protein
VSDPTSQPPLPGRPPAWNPENGNPDNEPTQVYGVPGQPPYDGQRQQPYDGQPQHYQQPPYYQQQPPPQYGQPAYGPPPGFQGGPPLPPQGRSKMPWLLAGAIALVVALIGGAGVILVNRSGGTDSAEPPVPTATFTDGLSSPEPSADPTDTPTTVPSPEPTLTPTPSPTPTPTERRRTLKDVDEGLKVYDDVYVKPAKGWVKARQTKYSVTLGSQSRTGVVVVLVSPIGLPAATAVPAVAQQLIAVDHLTGVRKEPVRTLTPANSNIGSQAEMSFTGRYTQSGVTVSLASRCTTMTGVASIHNVTVTVCVEARKDVREAAFRDAARMLASVARSI